MKLFQFPLLTFLVLILLTTETRGQQPTFIWNKNYGGTGSDNIKYSIKCKSGGYISVGTSNSPNGRSVSLGAYDVWVIRYNDDATIRWEKSYGGKNHEHGYSIVQTTDSNFVVVASINGSDGDVSKSYGDLDIWVFKINGDGSLIWDVTIGGTKNDNGYCVVATPDNGVVLTGATSSNDGNIPNYNGGVSDCIVAQIDENGMINLIKTFGGTNNDQGQKIISAKSGGYYLAGGTGSQDMINPIPLKGSLNIWVSKLDKNFDIEWQNVYGGTKVDLAYSILECDDKNLIVCGASTSNDIDLSSNKGDRDYFLMKLTNSGDLEWINNYGGMREDVAKDVIQTNNGYVVCGTTRSSDTNIKNFHSGIGSLHDFWIVTADTNGKMLSNMAFGGLGEERVNNIHLLKDSSYVMFGTSQYTGGDVNNNYGEFDTWIIRVGKWLDIENDYSARASEVSISPTITKSTVYINGLVQPSFVKIYNMSGKIVFDKELSTADFTIDMNKYINGVYIMSIFDNKNRLIKNQKIIKH